MRSMAHALSGSRTCRSPDIPLAHSARARLIAVSPAPAVVRGRGARLPARSRSASARTLLSRAFLSLLVAFNLHRAVPRDWDSRRMTYFAFSRARAPRSEVATTTQRASPLCTSTHCTASAGAGALSCRLCAFLSSRATERIQRRS